MTPATQNEAAGDAEILALSALAATLTDDSRAQRFLGLTGLSPDGIRGTLTDRSMLTACLAFLEAHEPDLVSVAAAVGCSPDALVRARSILEP